MRSLSINITGAGTHEAIPAFPGMRIIIMRLMLTFSHSETKAQPVTFLTGSTEFLGPFYVLDGGEIEYDRRDSKETSIELGDAFNIKLVAGLSAAGKVEFELGAS